MSKHTLGPWSVELHSSNPNKWNVVDDQGDMVSGYLPIDHAVLIAAAPKLLAALMDAVEDINDWASYASPYFQEKHGLAKTLAKHRALIAKIEGDAP